MEKVPTAGKARRSQIISTYGIGSIVDLVSGSYMPLGLEFIEKQSGKYLSGFEIKELRLQSVLGKSRFCGVVVPGQSHIAEWGQKIDSYCALPVTRFPNWLECPTCHRLGTVGDPFEQEPDNRVRCVACGGKTYVNPVRFILACRKGHINDFPWIRWAHQKSGKPSCENPKIYLLSRGRSSSLGDLYVTCKTCKSAEQSLGSIFIPGAVRVKCGGKRPWLLDNEDCDLYMETVQRGGSNIYFSVIASMISIPPESDALGQLLRDRPDLLNIEDAVGAEVADVFLKNFIKSYGLNEDVEVVKATIKQMKESSQSKAGDEELSSRHAEYRALGESNDPATIGNLIPEFENKVFKPGGGISKWFDLIGAVNRLREVRVCCGFTRIVPYSVSPEHVNKTLSAGKISPISKESRQWLPAAEGHGEGIFLRFRHDAVSIWEKDIRVQKRAKELDKIFVDHFERVGDQPPYHLTPRLLLVHSVSHLLIRRLSLDCGYSSSSLCERLYISESKSAPMCGILIYTASSDSDGSLGGLVDLARPDLIDQVVTDALRDAEWCANDPVCLENSPRNSGERFSGAACHSCLLLPETACEKFNRELDRAMLIGLADEGLKGFFKSAPD